jgi:hypothetical protein
MSKFEIWNQSSTDRTLAPVHILEADYFGLESGVYIFFNFKGQKLHAIVASPGIMVKKVGAD